MKLCTRSQVLASLCYSSSTLLYDDHLSFKKEDIASLPTISIASNSNSPVTTKENNSLLFLGGFLQPESAYQDYLSTAEYPLGVSKAKFYNYQNDDVEKLLDEIKNDPTISVLIGHSKGAKTLACCMPFLPRSIPCVLIEPVDVNPPRLIPSSSSSSTDGERKKEETHLLKDVWESNLETLSRVPTLIISAPYTDTNKRYGKATNLCAPVGYDSVAYYEVACRARKYMKQQQQHSTSTMQQTVAPLSFLEFPALGHNDIASSNLGACAHGPDQAIGSKLVAARVVEWLSLLQDQSDATTLKADEHSILKACS